LPNAATVTVQGLGAGVNMAVKSPILFRWRTAVTDNVLIYGDEIGN